MESIMQIQTKPGVLWQLPDGRFGFTTWNDCWVLEFAFTPTGPWIIERQGFGPQDLILPVAEQQRYWQVRACTETEEVLPQPLPEP